MVVSSLCSFWSMFVQPYQKKLSLWAAPKNLILKFYTSTRAWYGWETFQPNLTNSIICKIAVNSTDHASEDLPAEKMNIGLCRVSTQRNVPYQCHYYLLNVPVRCHIICYTDYGGGRCLLKRISYTQKSKSFLSHYSQEFKFSRTYYGVV